MFFLLTSPWLPRVYPTIGFRIVTERSSPEDLPRLEINELSSNPILAAFIPVSKLLLFLFENTIRGGSERRVGARGLQAPL